MSRLDAIHTALVEHGPCCVRELAVLVFGETPGETGRTPPYMLAYGGLRELENLGRVRRTRTVVAMHINTRAPVVLDLWEAQQGEPPRQRESAELAPARRLVLTHRMHLVLLGVLNDACIDDPTDIEVRQLRNSVKAAKCVRPAEREVAE